MPATISPTMKATISARPVRQAARVGVLRDGVCVPRMAVALHSARVPVTRGPDSGSGAGAGCLVARVGRDLAAARAEDAAAEGQGAAGAAGGAAQLLRARKPAGDVGQRLVVRLLVLVVAVLVLMVVVGVLGPWPSSASLVVPVVAFVIVIAHAADVSSRSIRWRR